VKGKSRWVSPSNKILARMWALEEVEGKREGNG